MNNTPLLSDEQFSVLLANCVGGLAEFLRNNPQTEFVPMVHVACFDEDNPDMEAMTLAFLPDITKQNEVEMMRSIGEFAAGENEPVRAVLFLAEATLRYMDEEEEVNQRDGILVTAITVDGRRAAAIIDLLRDEEGNLAGGPIALIEVVPSMQQQFSQCRAFFTGYKSASRGLRNKVRVSGLPGRVTEWLN